VLLIKSAALRWFVSPTLRSDFLVIFFAVAVVA
jgi:hypothetical protein